MFSLILVLGGVYLFIGSVVSFVFLRIYGIKDYKLLGFGIESTFQESRLQSQTQQEINESLRSFNESAILNKRAYKTIEILINKLFNIDLNKSVQQFIHIKHTLSQSQMYNNKTTTAIFIKYTVAFILFCLSLIPITLHQDQSYNTFEILYAFFDSPSVFCVLLSVFFIIRCILSDVLRFSWVGYFIESTMRCKNSTMLILCAFGTILYLGALNLLPFDLYHLGVWKSGVITLGVIVFIGLLDFNALLLLIITLCAFMFCHLNLSLAESIICPYLWLYSIIFSVIYGTQKLFVK